MTGKDRRWPVRAERQEPGHDHELGNGHSHGLSTDADRRYLVIALCLLGAFMLGEVIVAFASGSLALLSDAGHMLSDVGAIAGALWAIRLAARPAAGSWTFGWKRADPRDRPSCCLPWPHHRQPYARAFSRRFALTTSVRDLAIAVGLATGFGPATATRTASGQVSAAEARVAAT